MGRARVDAPEGIVVFDLIGQALGLYPLEALAKDMGRDPERLSTGAATPRIMCKAAMPLTP